MQSAIRAKTQNIAPARRVPSVWKRRLVHSLCLATIEALFLLFTVQLYAQSSKIRYLYDDLGRLVHVVNQANECATYEYDAVGNILSIRRDTNCLQPPIIQRLSPETARAGETSCMAMTGTNLSGGAVSTANADVRISRVRVSETVIDLCVTVSPFASAGPSQLLVSTAAGTAMQGFNITPRIAVIAQNITIGATDRSFDNSVLTIDGPVTVAVDGSHAFESLTLRNGAVLMHSPTSATSAGKLELTIAGRLHIDGTSRIDVSGRGFLGGKQPGNPFVLDGMTVGFQRGSTSFAGGSYGGLGGWSGGGVPNPAYGDFRNPNEPGSGGATLVNSPSGNGGGLVRIVAQTIQLDGSIIANGQNGPENVSGGGSGGGIRIDAGTLSGGGRISANGGTSSYDGGAGGGGRIAIYYQNAGGFNFTNLSAFGGVRDVNAVQQNGAPGTVYVQGPGRENGELILDNNNMVTPSLLTRLQNPSNGPIALTHLRVRRQARVRIDGVLSLTGSLEIHSNAEVAVSDRVAAGAVNVSGNSLLSHVPATGVSSFKLDLNAASLTIDATSRIDVSGRGFLGGRQPGNPFWLDGMTVGFQRGSTSFAGGSYGGLGGSSNGGVPNTVYGDLRNPNDPGSGGATLVNEASGNGGGLVRIVAQMVQLDGWISTNGQNGSGNNSGGGSGGGIRIDVGTISGTGQIRAHGGNSSYSGGAGGGGRIAIYYRDASAFNMSNVTALGGTGGFEGQNGTVFAQQQGALAP
jgi:YD repeat-containing protein